jgi:hypothetical protein
VCHDTYAKRASCDMPARRTVELVICRHREDVAWAMELVKRISGLTLVVYNNGESLQNRLVGPRLEERQIANVGREAYCYVSHMISIRERASGCDGGSCVSDVFIFSQAAPFCMGSWVHASRRTDPFQLLRCDLQIGLKAEALAAGAKIAPRGFVDLEPTMCRDRPSFPACCGCCLLTRLVSMCAGSVHRWDAGQLEGLFSHSGGVCLASTMRNLTADRWERIFNGSLLRIQYSPHAAFAVERRNILQTPGGWLRRAKQSFEASRPFPWLDVHRRAKARTTGQRKHAEQMACCEAGRTCLPWVLERLWATLLTAVPEPSSCASSLDSESAELALRFDITISSALTRTTAGMPRKQYRALLQPSSEHILQQLAPYLERNVSLFPGPVRPPARVVRRWKRNPVLQHAVHHECFSVVRNHSLLISTLPRILAPPTNVSHDPVYGPSSGPIRVRPTIGSQEQNETRSGLAHVRSAMQRLYSLCVGLVLQEFWDPVTHSLSRLQMLGGAQRLLQLQLPKKGQSNMGCRNK